MRARQSATSLLGAQARAGVRPGADRERQGGSKRHGQGRGGGGKAQDTVGAEGAAFY